MEDVTDAGEPGGADDHIRWIEVDGMALRVLDLPGPAGGPAEPFFVIPGHTARIDGFEVLAPLLATQRRTIVLDFPGSGESAKPARRYDLLLYEDVAVLALDELGVGAAIPVGGSLGGNLVLRLGHRFPERFPRLALWAPGSAWKAKPVLAALTERLMGRRMFWPVVKVQSRYWYSPDYPLREAELDETFAYYRRVMSPGFLAMYWGMAADQLRHSLFDLAPDIRQPTLLMWGDQDDGARMGHGVATLDRLLPAVTFRIFPGQRHSLEAECPERLAEEILAFCAPRRA